MVVNEMVFFIFVGVNGFFDQVFVVKIFQWEVDFFFYFKINEVDFFVIIEKEGVISKDFEVRLKDVIFIFIKGFFG